MRPIARFFLAALVVLTLCGAGSAAFAETVTLSGTDPVIYNLIGTMSVTAGSGGAVTVDIVRGGADGSKLTLDQSANRLVVVFPGQEFVYKTLGWGSSANLQINDDGTFGQGHGGRRVTVRGSGSGLQAYADLKISLPRGKKLALYLGVGKVEVHNAEGELRLSTMAGDVAGEGFRGPLSANTGSGDITLSRIDGKVELNTGSGDISVSDVSGTAEFNTGSGDLQLSRAKGPSLTAQTGSGNISVREGEMQKMVLRTGSGDLEVEDSQSTALTLETGSGDISATLAQMAPTVEARAGSGDVSLIFPRGLDAKIEASFGSGDIDIDLPVSSSQKQKHEYQGVAGAGKGQVTVETGSGDIDLNTRGTPAEKAP